MKKQMITEAELINAVNREGLGTGHPFETELDLGTAKRSDIMKQLPGTIGVTRSGNDVDYVCYTVDEERKMTHMTKHETWEEGFAEALNRYRAFAKESGFVKANGDSFHYGPVSGYRSVEETLERDRQLQEHEADPPYLESECAELWAEIKGREYEYSIMMEEPKKHACACMKWLPNGCSHQDGVYGDLLKVIESTVNNNLKADVEADWFSKGEHFSYRKKVNCDSIHIDLTSSEELEFDDITSCIVDLFQKMDSLAEASSYEPGMDGYMNAYKDANDLAAAVNDLSQTDIMMER